VFRIRPLRIPRSVVAPSPCPYSREWIDFATRKRLLVADQRSLWRMAGIDAALPSRFPKHLVPAEKREMDRVGRAVSGSLDVGALLARPILVVPDGEEDFMFQDFGAAQIAICAGEVADVVPLLLEPPHHRVFAVEHPILGGVLASVERPVVADLIRTAGGRIA